MRPWSKDERDRVDRLRRGDEQTFARLVEDYHGRLVRLARTFVRSDAVAQEVVQETWLAVLQGVGKFEGRSSLTTWIFRILVNRARTRGVREARSIPMSAMDDAGESESAVPAERFTERGAWAAPPGDWGRDPEKRLLAVETMGVLGRALEELPAAQRTVVTFRDVEGLSAEEVCNILEIGETNQRVLLHRGRSRLRRALARHLGDG